MLQCTHFTTYNLNSRRRNLSLLFKTSTPELFFYNIVMLHCSMLYIHAIWSVLSWYNVYFCLTTYDWVNKKHHVSQYVCWMQANGFLIDILFTYLPINILFRACNISASFMNKCGWKTNKPLCNLYKSHPERSSFHQKQCTAGRSVLPASFRSDNIKKHRSTLQYKASLVLEGQIQKWEEPPSQS